MKKLQLCFLALISLTFTGCRTAAAFNEMSPTPTATISGDWLTVHLGADTKGPLSGVRPQARVEGSKVYITGRHTHHSISREFSLTIPAQAGAVEVFWVEPDKSTVAIPITITKQPSHTDPATVMANSQ